MLCAALVIYGEQFDPLVLRWFARAGHLDLASARDMGSRDHGGGFSLLSHITGRFAALACQAPRAT
jgi:hypothetical protein